MKAYARTVCVAGFRRRRDRGGLPRTPAELTPGHGRECHAAKTRSPHSVAPVPRPAEAPLALAGIRVADFSHFIAGPLCSLMLADLGAEVIKIEKADGGDDFRRIRPMMTEREGAPYLWANRNKRASRSI